MCGIAGYFTKNFRNNLNSNFEDAQNAIIHRGAVGAGLYINEQAGLGLLQTLYYLIYKIYKRGALKKAHNYYKNTKINSNLFK